MANVRSQMPRETFTADSEAASTAARIGQGLMVNLELTGLNGCSASPETEIADLPPTMKEVLTSSPEWQLVCRICASKGLAKSELLRRFLLYSCKQYLLGNPGELTEQRIGVYIFNRPSDYNPGEDNIVRSYARLLRKRLDAYFEGEGADAPVRMVVPRGGYVPAFIPNSESSIRERKLQKGQSEGAVRVSVHSAGFTLSSAIATESSHTCSGIARLPRWKFGLLCFMAGITLACSFLFAGRVITEHQRFGPAHTLWLQLFRNDRNTLIVPADSGLGILENLTSHPAAMEDYANGSFIAKMALRSGLDKGNFGDLSQQRYTSMVDLDISSRLMKLPEMIPSRTQVRFARSLAADDIRTANLILLGSKHTDPWIALFEKQLNFRLEFSSIVDDSYVTNEKPLENEQKVYRNGNGAALGPTYGVIAYLPEPEGSGQVLIIEGLNMAATEAAADVLFKANMINPLLDRARRPDGSFSPFEVLVRTSSLGATAPGVQVVATRIYQ